MTPRIPPTSSYSTQLLTLFFANTLRKARKKHTSRIKIPRLSGHLRAAPIVKVQLLSLSRAAPARVWEKSPR